MVRDPRDSLVERYHVNADGLPDRETTRCGANPLAEIEQTLKRRSTPGKSGRPARELVVNEQAWALLNIRLNLCLFPAANC